MKKEKMVCEPQRARDILQELDRRCLETARRVGDEMGFTVDKANFVIDKFPVEIISIEYDFKLKIKV